MPSTQPPRAQWTSPAAGWLRRRRWLLQGERRRVLAAQREHCNVHQQCQTHLRAVPELSSCTSSGRTWRGARLWAARHSQEGRPGYWAPSHRLSCSSWPPPRPSVPHFHRRRLCRHKTTGKFFQHDETRSRRLLLHKAPNSSRSLSPSPRPSLSPSPRTNPTKPDPSSSPHPEPHPKPHQAPCASPSTLSLTKAEIRKLGAECDKKGLTIVPPSGLSTVPSWQCHSVLPWLRGALGTRR